MRKSPGSKGFSLIEVLIMTCILAAVMGVTFGVITSVIRQDDALRRRLDLQLSCSRALKEMSSLLKQAGTNTDPTWGSYPMVFPIGMNGVAGLMPLTYSYALNFSQIQPTTLFQQDMLYQIPNAKDVEGLGPSNGILFRIAKDSDNPDGTRSMAVNKGTTVATYDIQWGNEFHGFMVVRDLKSIPNRNILQHQVWAPDALGAMKPKSVRTLAYDVHRLYIESSVGAAPGSTPPWPLPSLATSSANGLSVGWAAPLTNPFEIRITLCLALPDLRNPSNNLQKPERISYVWQQIIVNMRSVQH
jgi:Tfp pilus assembly protein PilV